MGQLQFWPWLDGIMVKAIALALRRNEAVEKERDYWRKIAQRHVETIAELRETIRLIDVSKGGE